MTDIQLPHRRLLQIVAESNLVLGNVKGRLAVSAERDRCDDEHFGYISHVIIGPVEGVLSHTITDELMPYFVREPTSHGEKSLVENFAVKTADVHHYFLTTDDPSKKIKRIWAEIHGLPVRSFQQVDFRDYEEMVEKARSSLCWNQNYK